MAYMYHDLKKPEPVKSILLNDACVDLLINDWELRIFELGRLRIQINNLNRPISLK